MAFAARPLAGASPQSSPNTLTQSLQAAEAAYEKQQFKQAEDILKGVLARFPKDYAANELMGLVLTAEGKDAAASPFFKAAVQAAPSSAPARGNLAANLAQLHENSLAEQEFRSALNLEPGNYDLNHNLGEFYIGLGKISSAIPYLREAQRLKPASYNNGYDLALAELKVGMLAEAEAHIQALLKVQETAELHSLLGDVWEKQGKFVAAATQLQRAAQMEPSEANLFDWGAELLRHQTPEPAIPVFSRGVELYPRSWRMQAGLGVSLYMEGFNDRAVEALCRAIDIDPADSRPYFFLARVLPAVPPALVSQVSERFERYVKAQPKSAQARFYYALSLWNSAAGDAETANRAKVEALVREALALDPKFADAHLQLGIIYSEQQNYAEAVREYRRTLELNPSLYVAHYRLGQALVRLGDEAGGEQELLIWRQQRSRQEAADEKERSQMLRFIYTTPGSDDSKR